MIRKINARELFEQLSLLLVTEGCERVRHEVVKRLVVAECHLLADELPEVCGKVHDCS